MTRQRATFRPKKRGTHLAYNVTYEQRAIKELQKIDRRGAERILDFIDSRLSRDPSIGKKLKGAFKDLYRARLGNYRVIYALNNKELIILVLRISHRKDAYKGML